MKKEREVVTTDEDEEMEIGGVGVGEKPSMYEKWGWYAYEFCSYFVQTVLIPVVFPLIISQLQQISGDPLQDWLSHHQGFFCAPKEILLYSKLTKHSIKAGGSSFSPLGWTSIAWGGGLVLSIPALAFISFQLDSQHHHPLFQYSVITAASTALGVFFCLPAGFFKTTKIFIPYIAFIALATTLATASHTHYLSLMLRPFGVPTPALNRTHFLTTRLPASSKLSLYATALGSLGAAIVSSLTYHMLREPTDRDLLSLWVVSIFSGLIWLAGVVHVALTSPNRTTTTTSTNNVSNSISFSSSSWFHPFSVFKYPHAIGGLFGVFLSSFATMSIFTGGVLFVVGELCIKPVHLLYFWLAYFLFPLASLPLLNPLQNLIKVNSVKMQILGLLLSIFSSGFGFYFWRSHWKWGHLVLFGGIQGTATGVLHSFGRVLLLNCAPYGREGAFSVWYAWVRSVGLCLGFTVGSVVPGRVRSSLGAAFCASLVGILVLLFGNVSDFGGAAHAGRVTHQHHQTQQDTQDCSSLDDSKQSVTV